MAFALCLAIPAQATAQTVVASEDFDGGAVNLISGFTAADNLDGGGGDWYGLGSLDAWPQVEGVPFGLTDESGTVFSDR